MSANESGICNLTIKIERKKTRKNEQITYNRISLLQIYIVMSNLSIAVIGVRGIGSAFAFKLAKGGHKVTCIARPGSKRLQQLRKDNNNIVLVEGDRASVIIADALNEEIEYDVIIVTTLAHQVHSILPSLQRSKAKYIHFMFNDFNPESLLNIIGINKATFGMPFIMSSLTNEGKVNFKLNPGQKCLHNMQQFVELFNSVGLPSEIEENMFLWLRCHTPLCIGFESISVLAMRHNSGAGAGATWSESVLVASGVHAGFSVIQSLGYKLYPSAKGYLNHLPNFVLAAIFWSMSRIMTFRELLATGKEECKALIDTMIEAANSNNSITPTTVAALVATV